MFSGLVFGILDTSRDIADDTATDTYRGFTISWSRYGYQDVIIQRDSVNGILDAAVAGGHRYCFIQSYGCVLAERWKLEERQHPDFFAALEAWVSSNEFLISGELTGQSDTWYGFEPGCLLVDLKVYERLGSPAFDVAADGAVELPSVDADQQDERIVALWPTARTEMRHPTLWGWNMLRAGIEADLPASSFSSDIRSHTLNLEATSAVRRNAMQPFLGDGIAQYDGLHDVSELTVDQRAFLDVLKPQTGNARNGVFLWNIESYADIESPRDDFRRPVSTLYGVAAGFKPARMLFTHGFGPDTRVVYFDYSPAALTIKQRIVEQWDGEDFPRFVDYLFREFPHPETFYQLWDNVTPDNVDPKDIDFVWQRELQRWGGPDRLKSFWQEYSQLKHEYVLCNLLMDPAPLLESITNEPSAMIWWSNAFFTMYGNWFYSIGQRKQAYDHWAKQLAEVNPHLHLFGSDFNNTNVNSIRAGEYWEQYRRTDGDGLSPCKLYRTEIRM